MLECDMVVADAGAAFSLYEEVFGAKSLQKSDNEVIFELEGTRFHFFDENPAIGWQAPQSGAPQPYWFNLILEDAEEVFEKAVTMGFVATVPLRNDTELGILNGVLRDPFGYSWIIEKILRKISFTERCRILGERMAQR